MDRELLQRIILVEDPTERRLVRTGNTFSGPDFAAVEIIMDDKQGPMWMLL